MLSVKDQTVPYVAMLYIIFASNFPIDRNSSVKLRFGPFVPINLKI